MNFTSQKTGIGRGSLAREGVQPHASNLLAGTRYSGASINGSIKARDQLSSAQLPVAIPSYMPTSKASSKVLEGGRSSQTNSKRPRSLADLPSLCSQPYYLLHSRSDWISLGDGWHQVSIADSGETSKVGLHSVIDNNSAAGAPFVCIYEPRLQECYSTCTSSEPFYDLLLQAKIIHSHDPMPHTLQSNREASGQAVAAAAFGNSHSRGSAANPSAMLTHALVPNFQVIFCFKNFSNYLSLTCDLSTRSWILSHCSAENGDSVMSRVIDQSIRANQFFHVLIQLRGTYLSIDINNLPVFTSVRCPEGMTDLSGLPGLAARGGAKFALKGWRLLTKTPGSLKVNGANRGGGGIISAESVEPAPELTSPVHEAKIIPEQLYDARELEYEEEAWQYSSQDSGGASDRSLNITYSQSASVLNLPSNTPINAVSRKGAMSLADMMKNGSTAENAGKSMSLADLLLQRKGNRESFAQASTSSVPGPAMKQALPAPPSVFLSHGGGGPGRTQLPLPVGARAVSAPDSASVLQASDKRAMQRANGGLGLPVSYNANANASALQNRKVEPSEILLPPSTASLPYAGDRRLLETAQTLMQMHEKSVVDTVLRDVVQRALGVTFQDIAALDTAKRLLSEAVVLPLMVPEFFTGIREPWKGVLLFGPPGTGKTLLAKAVCGLNQSSFFNCPSSSLVSKYRGESEKIVRCLFEAARLLAPSVVFLDEVDALVGSRGSEGEHEASRRLKTEIFSQMDGIASTNSNTASEQAAGVGVMVLATTNCPWDLDEAMRRRLEKRIFIPMPDFSARRALLIICLRGISMSSDVDIDQLCALTEGYSGADIHVVCREAAMMPMRKLLQQVQPLEIQAMRAAGQLQVANVVMQDFLHALENTMPSVNPDTIARYASWMATYGSS